MKKFLIFLAICLLFFNSFRVEVNNQTLSKKYNVYLDQSIIDESNKLLMLQVGVVEKPKDSNWGPEVSKYIMSTGIKYAVSYCGSGQYWCLKESAKAAGIDPIIGIPFVARKAASALYWFTKGQEVGTLTTFIPEVNDIVVWRNTRSAGKGHVGRIIETGQLGWVKTVEFNTSSGQSGSQDNGGGVYIRSRNLNGMLGALAIKGLVGLKPIKKLDTVHIVSVPVHRPHRKHIVPNHNHRKFVR